MDLVGTQHVSEVARQNEEQKGLLNTMNIGFSSWILFVSNRDFGIARSRLALIQELQTLGYRLEVLARPTGYQSHISSSGARFTGANFASGQLSLREDLSASVRVLTRSLRRRPEMIHTFNPKPIALGAFPLFQALSTRQVCTVTGLGPIGEGSLHRPLPRLALRRIMSAYDAVVFQNPEHLDIFCQKRLLAPERAHLVVGSGVDIDRFRPNEVTTERSVPRVLFCGRLLKAKGIYEFLQAAEILVSTGHEVEFVVAGALEGSNPDGVGEEDLRMAERNGLINFLGFVEDVPSLMRDADVVAVPSHHEGLPRTILEAFATGVPVVASDIPGCRGAVDNGETGLLVPPSDSWALADALDSLLGSPHQRKRLGANGRYLAVNKFSKNVICNQYLEVYRAAGLAGC